MNRDEIRKIYEAGPEAVIELIERLFKRIEDLERRINRNSSNSNKPPSSDGLNRKSRRALERKKRKKQGGQNGHEGVQLKMKDEVDHKKIYHVSRCRKCNTSLKNVAVKSYRKRQVFDIPPVSIEVTEHQVENKECPVCGSITEATFPEGVTRPVQYGSRIKGIISYLNQYQLIPYERTSELLNDIFGIKISKGTIFNTNREAYKAGEVPERTIKELLKKQSLLHADETGIFCDNDLKWLHVVSNDKLTYYMMHEKRGKEAINDMGIIPDYTGRLVHDFWNSYLSFNICEHIFCNTHIVRELTGIYENFGQKWAKEMAELLILAKKTADRRTKRLNSPVIRRFTDNYERIIRKGFLCNQHPPEEGIIRRGRKKKSKGRNLLERLQKYQSSILGFINDITIPFDNNQAERDLRMIKVQQKISGCFRSIEGAQFYARLRGYISTVKKHDENVLNALQGLFEYKPFIPKFAE